MNVSDQEKKAISELTNSILAKWINLHRLFPNILYHYTSADGLIGILSSKSIWLTDLRYVNDASELQYAKTLIRRRIEEKSQKTSLLPEQSEFLKRIQNSFDLFSNRFSAFSTSFCEEGNLLSQWRAYRGLGGGYAIGFDFFHSLRFLNRPCALRKVIYDERQQVEQIDTTIELFLESIAKQTANKAQEHIGSSILPAFCQAFSITVVEYLFCFKHPDFHEEKEWRLVYSCSVDPTLERDKRFQLPLFRSYNGNVIPYHVVSLEQAINASKDDLYGVPFPIAEVVIGPTVSSELNLESLRIMLLAMNPDIVPNIRQSEIPLRWL
jgi:hypothetical protein